MLKANRKYLLLLLILTFSFIYRMLLMLWNNYPSGAAVKKEDADAIGALFGKNKEEAPELAKKALKK